MRVVWTEQVRRLPLAEMAHPELKALHTHWLACCEHGEAARQQALSLDLLRPFMHQLALVQLETAPVGARYLVVGAGLRSLLGTDPSGRRIESCYPRAVAREVYEAFSGVQFTQRPAYYRRDLRLLGQQFGYHRLLLPLRGRDDEGIRRLMVAIYPVDARFTHARQWLGLLGGRGSDAEQLDAMQRRWSNNTPPP